MTIPVAGTYEACKPGALPADQVRMLETIHLVFVRTLASNLGNYLETPLSMILQSIDQTDFSTFLDTGGGEHCLMRLEAESGQGQVLVAFSWGFIFRVLGVLIGASTDSRPERRSMTEIEEQLINECFAIISHAIQDTWARYGVEIGAMQIESLEAGTYTPDTQSRALAASFIAKFGENEECFGMAISALLVRMATARREPLKAAPAAPVKPERLVALKTARVQVQAILTGARLPFKDLVAMTPGKILVLGLPGDSGFDCVINGRTKFRGRLLARGNRQVFQVEAPCEALA